MSSSSSGESSTAATEPTDTVPLSTVFCADDADVVICAAGTMDFRVHKLILSLASPIFKDMFTVPQPPSDTLPHVNVHEPAQTWENILRTIYPMQNPIIDSQEELESLLLAATKYEMQYVIDLHKKGLENPTFILQDPLHLYAIACACGFGDQAKYVARHAQLLMVTRRPNLGDLKGLTMESHHRLVSFLAERDYQWHQTLTKKLTSHSAHCSCDKERKEAFYNEIGEDLKVWHLQTEEIYLKALENPRRLVSRCGTATNCVFRAPGIESFIGRRIKEREVVCDKLMWR